MKTIHILIALGLGALVFSNTNRAINSAQLKTFKTQLNTTTAALLKPQNIILDGFPEKAVKDWRKLLSDFINAMTDNDKKLFKKETDFARYVFSNIFGGTYEVKKLHTMLTNVGRGGESFNKLEASFQALTNLVKKLEENFDDMAGVSKKGKAASREIKESLTRLIFGYLFNDLLTIGNRILKDFALEILKVQDALERAARKSKKETIKKQKTKPSSLSDQEKSDIWRRQILYNQNKELVDPLVVRLGIATNILLQPGKKGNIMLDGFSPKAVAIWSKLFSEIMELIESSEYKNLFEKESRLAQAIFTNLFIFGGVTPAKIKGILLEPKETENVMRETKKMAELLKSALDHFTEKLAQEERPLVPDKPQKDPLLTRRPETPFKTLIASLFLRFQMIYNKLLEAYQQALFEVKGNAKPKY